MLFRQKIENRNRRCSLGFLMSWNGFTGTVTKEMLRGSREETLVVPVLGSKHTKPFRINPASGALTPAWLITSSQAW